MPWDPEDYTCGPTGMRQKLGGSGLHVLGKDESAANRRMIYGRICQCQR